MSKIYFKTGCMGSGKTLDLARVKFNYEERGMTVLLYKPMIDTRDGDKVCCIGSRALGYKIPAKWIPARELYNFISLDINSIEQKPSVIIVDESQFLTKEEVDIFQKICYNYNIPIIFYGLKNTFQGNLFEGSRRIIEVCDKIEEFKCMCSCGKVARQNARIVDGKIAREGDIIAIGGNELYLAVCNECFFKGEVQQ